MTASRPTRRSRGHRRLLVATVLAALAVALVGRWFVWPSTAAPVRVDAVVVLGGGSGERLDRAWELMQSNVAPTIVLSAAAVQEGAARGLTCGETDPAEVRCFQPNPYNTAGEARAIGELVDREGWASVAVVTSSHHVARAGTLVRQCTDAAVSMVAAPVGASASGRVFAVAREVVAWLAGVSVARACV